MLRKVLLSLVMILAVAEAMAAPVSRATARARAQAFMKERGIAISKQCEEKESPRKIASITGETPCYYVFNNGDDEGFVIVSGDDRNPGHSAFLQYPGQLGMIRPFLEIETVSGAGDALDDLGAEPGTTVICLPVHVDVDRFRIESPRKIQLALALKFQGMLDDFRRRYQQGAGGLPGELDLSLEIGMLVHEIQKIAIDDRELFPYCRADITVIVHIAVKYETHIDRARLILSFGREMEQRQEQQCY